MTADELRLTYRLRKFEVAKTLLSGLSCTFLRSTPFLPPQVFPSTPLSSLNVEDQLEEMAVTIAKRRLKSNNSTKHMRLRSGRIMLCREVLMSAIGSCSTSELAVWELASVITNSNSKARQTIDDEDEEEGL